LPAHAALGLSLEFTIDRWQELVHGCLLAAAPGLEQGGDFPMGEVDGDMPLTNAAEM
jgi:hypothetical protein